MNLRNILIPLLFSGAFMVGCQEDRPLWVFGPYIYNDIEFDKSVVDCVITPESDTLYFGFHKRGDQAPEGHFLGNGCGFNIARWSTAKCNRDFTVPAINDNDHSRGYFSAECNLTDSTGNFMIIIKPERVTTPLYIKITKYNSFPELSYSKQQVDTMTINLIPQQDQL